MVKGLVFGFLVFLVVNSSSGMVAAESAWPEPIGAMEAIYPRVIETTLRTDRRDVQESGNYFIPFQAAQFSEGATGKDYTDTALNLALCERNYNIESNNCVGFRFGILATRDHVRFFVYTPSLVEVECLRGARMWGDGCLGARNAIVGLKTWHVFQVVRKSDGYWELRVSGYNKMVTVARIKSSAPHLIGASVTYHENPEELDKPIMGGFWNRMPMYYWQGSWHNWPGSVVGGELEQRNLAEAFGNCPNTQYLHDKIEPSGGRWYTGKPIEEVNNNRCAWNPLF